ncbi:MAG: hypothetical protein K6T63_07440 [Alicyclobacillus herbarius]|uniref:hypothetical protein n=1 Tax=Alicyclobacillus herbarius TaxID=122960 RepID=UPI002355B912|nr:hypothetical protein [Alicyclobacillus herbarius]MCL6632454.1 hypothetical protein [Alicyclobacillus herbarius]
MEYLVFVRFEESPAAARRHVEVAESVGLANYVLNSRYYARPGEETPWLEQALEEARGRNVFIALYRGRPIGQDFEGNALFYPLDLVWCKDDVELAQMIGVPWPSATESGTASADGHSGRAYAREDSSPDPARLSDDRKAADESRRWKRRALRTKPDDDPDEGSPPWSEPWSEDTRWVSVPARDRATSGDVRHEERTEKSPSSHSGLRTFAWFVVCLVAAFLVAYLGARAFLG